MNVRVNGVSYDVPDGSNISTNNGVLYVNGKKYDGTEPEDRKFVIEITGGVASVKVERGDVTVNGNSGPVDAGGTVNVTGNVSGKVDAGGNVTCTAVTGDVDAGGNVDCGDVKGGVDAGGNVKCGSIGGDVDAGGNVRHG